MSKLSSERRQTLLGFQPPAIGEDEIAAVTETLRSGWLTSGPRAAELERRMAEFLEADHVLALASGTAALHLSLVALGVGPDDEVITSPITWPATANVIVHTGATPVIEDAAHAAESYYRGRKVGSIADATCFSMYATKNIAAGEGGLIATNRGDVP